MNGGQEFSRDPARLEPADDYEVEPARAERPEDILRRLNSEAAARYAAANPPPEPKPAPLRQGAFSLRYLLGATTLFAILFAAMRTHVGAFVIGLALLMAFSMVSRDEFYGTRVELLLWCLTVVYFAVSIAMWVFVWTPR